MKANESPDEIPLRHPVPRPPGQLHLYHVGLRWELTRRHPYYQVLWEEVHRYHQHATQDTVARREFGFAAKHYLGVIGVTGDPVDPGTDGNALIEDFPPELMDGTFHPVTILELAKMFVASLQPETLLYLGQKFTEVSEARCSGEDGPEQYAKKVLKLQAELSRTMAPDFAKFPVAPLFYVHLDASQNTIVDDAKYQVNRWKILKGIAEKPPKINPKKASEYLEVWDLREGWTGKGYDLGQAMEFAAIARKLKLGLSTVHSRYTSAFELVTGVAYSFERRLSLLGPMNAAGTSPETARMYMNRFLRRFTSQGRREVPETLIEVGKDDSKAGGVIESKTAVLDSHEMKEDAEEIVSLIKKGYSDEQIRQNMEYKGTEIITHFRSMIAAAGDFPS